MHEHHDDGGDQELAVRQHTHLQHGLLHAQLAAEEERERNRADDDAASRIGGHAVAADGGQAVQQAAESERGQEDRNDIELDVLVRFAASFKRCAGEHDDRCAQHGNDPEHDMPVRLVDDDAGNGGAGGRGERDDDAEHAHGGAATVDGERPHEHGHHQRHKDAGAGGLHQTASQQHGEVRAPGGKRGAAREQNHGHEEQSARGEAVGQESGDGHHDGVDQRKPGGQPLRRCGIDAHFGHDGRQRRRHHRLVEHRDERAEHQHGQHDDLLAGQAPVSHERLLSARRGYGRALARWAHKPRAARGLAKRICALGFR